MKRLLLFLVLGLSAASVSAQFMDYVTMQDTDVYMINPMPDSLQGGEGFSHPSSVPLGVILQRYVPQSPLIVYGIALTLSDFRGKDTIYQNPEYYAVLMQRSSEVPDSVYHGTPPPPMPPYTITYRTLHYLDSLAMDTTQCSIKYSKFRYEFSYPKFSYGNVPCYELYFDEPRVMTDTFYVGRKYFGNAPYAREYDGINRSSVTYTYCWYSAYGGSIFIDYGCHYQWGFAFPIIGFHCKPLDEENYSLLLTDVNDNGATVHWYSVEDGATYNVRLTSADGSIDSTVVTSDSSYAFYGLPTNHRYNVQVRKQCYYATDYYDTTVYSPWTMTNTSFTLGVDTTGTGGGGDDTTHTAIVSVDGVDFAVSPNPVHGVLSVTFPRPLAAGGQLSLYDLGGREVRRMTVADGSAKADFDTEGCPAGAYILKLVSPQGTSSCRLVVE